MLVHCVLSQMGAGDKMAEQQSQGLDGLGLLGQCAPAPCAFAVMRARVLTEAGITEQHVLALVGATGAHVTYWSRESLTALRDKLTEELGGLQIASSLDVAGAAALDRK